MKKGLSVWSCPASWSIEQIFAAAERAGFDGVELALAEEGAVNLSSTKEDMQKIRQLAESRGIELYSVASGLYWQYSLTSDCAEMREKAMSIVRKQLNVASWLGCDTILVVPGAVGVGFAPGLGTVSYDTAYERALSALKELAADAEKAGVTIGVENVWNKFLTSPLEMRDFIDGAASPYIAAYFDVGNVLNTGYPEHWIKILGSRIKKVHFKDFVSAVGNLDGFCPLLAGDVNYPAVMKAFDEAGYDGWVTAEVGVMQGYPMAGIEHTSNAMDYILGRKV